MAQAAQPIGDHASIVPAFHSLCPNSPRSFCIQSLAVEARAPATVVVVLVVVPVVVMCWSSLSSECQDEPDPPPTLPTHPPAAAPPPFLTRTSCVGGLRRVCTSVTSACLHACVRRRCRHKTQEATQDTRHPRPHRAGLLVSIFALLLLLLPIALLLLAPRAGAS